MARRSSEYRPRQSSAESTSAACKELTFCSKNHQAKAFDTFQEMRSNMELCDIVLKAGNLSFNAHRLVLAGSSSYFREVVALKESREGRELILPQNLKPVAVRAMLDYFYSGFVVINLDNAEALLHSASALKVDELIEVLVEFVSSSLQTSSCLLFYSMAQTFGFTDMMQKIDRFIDWNFRNISREPAFLQISVDHVMKIVTSENLRVKREETVYEAVWNWFKYDRINRKEAVAEIFKQIRFCQISPKYLSKHVIPEMVEGEGICKADVKKALEYYRDYKTTTSDGNPRKPRDIMYVFSCKSLAVERFDPIKCACVPCREMTQVETDDVTDYRYAAVVGKNLYTVTGARVEIFDPLALCWNSCCEGLDVRDKGICVGKDCIYVLGGRASTGKAVWKFDALSHEWESLPDMTTSRRSPGAAFISNKLYAIGGYGEAGPLATCERLDMKTHKWSAMKPMSKQRFHLGVLVEDGYIYAIGGRNNEESLDSVETFHPKTAKEWSLLPERMNEARNEFGVVACDKKIFCLGGRGVTTIEVFDTEKKEWKVMGAMGDNHFCINALHYPPV